MDSNVCMSLLLPHVEVTIDAATERKQVERSRIDLNMLVITYTSDHNHPWPTH